MRSAGHLQGLVRTAFSVAFALLGLPGCGADVVSTERLPTLPPGVALPLDECAPPLVVPGGEAWVGGLRWVGGSIMPNSCHPEGAPGDKALHLMVPPFFMDADEVTNACYGECVKAGRCTPPLAVSEGPSWDDVHVASSAALLDRSLAAIFCEWRGGRLPTLPELVRAAHGGALSVLNSALEEFWIDCAEDRSRPDCDPIALVNRLDSWPIPVRSWALDLGPFGHYDLAAALPELTQSNYAYRPEEKEALCQIADGASAPQTFGTAEVTFLPGANIVDDPVEGRDLIWIVLGSGEGLTGAVHCVYDPSGQ